MKRFIMTMWLAGCADGETGDQPPTEKPDMGTDLDIEQDIEHKEECATLNVATLCPLNWAWTIQTGSDISEGNPGFVELEDVAEPLCNGKGLYATSDDFTDALGGPEVTVIHNSQCRVTCFPQCGFTNVCYTGNPEGRACGHACTPLDDITREECEAFIAECIGDVMACE